MVKPIRNRRTDPTSAGAAWRRFLRDCKGNISLIAALSLPVLVLSVGGGIDLTRAYAARQDLANVVELSCYQSGVEITYLRGQPENANKTAADFLSVANDVSSRRLTATKNSGTIQNSISNDVLTVKGTGSSQNVFGTLLGAKTVPVGAQRTCNVAKPATNGGSGSMIFMESFESNHGLGINSWNVLQNWNGWLTQNAGV